MTGRKAFYFGYLCLGCDTAVIHTPELATILYGGHPRSGWKAGLEFAGAGLINLDAVLPEIAHTPIPDLGSLPLAHLHSRRSKEFRSAARRKRSGKVKQK
jgi:hypothetical protein